MSQKKYTFIDLFAGCGGLSEGFLQTGKYNGLAHVEWETPMIETLRTRLVEKCKSKNRNCNWECYGGVIVMEAMRDDTEFQNEYKSLQAFLERRMDACNKRTNPAEKVMTDEEIRLVVYEKPGLIGRCAHPSEAVQMTACKQSPSVVQFIDEPTPAVVDMLAERHPKNVLLIKTQFRTAKSEIKALNAGVLGLNQINKTRLVSNDYNATEPWNENEIVNMVRVERKDAGFVKKHSD